jgi:ATP-binding cassette subfamily C (CFTR/MRP) protein 1
LQTVCSILAAVQISLVAIWGSANSHHTKLTTPSAICALLSTIAMAGLLSFENSRTLAPSFIVQTFLFSTTILDIARVRTQWLLPSNVLAASLLTVSLIVKLILLSLESFGKWGLIVNEKTSPTVETYGIFGRSLLLWLNPLMTLGYRKSLALEDLSPLEADLDSRLLTYRLASVWNTGE